MHKTLTSLLVLGAATLAFAAGPAKPFPRDQTGRVRFQEVVSVDGVPAADLYSRAKLWAARAFKSAKDVIQLDDPASGRLVLRGMHSEPYMGAHEVWYRFTLAVEVKEGRYRWTLDQVEYTPDGGRGWPIERELTAAGVGIVTRKAVHERFRVAILALAADLEKAMNATASGDEW